MPPNRLYALFPTAACFLITIILAATVLAYNQWDALALARLGMRFSQTDSQGTEGYDGQFVYYIARDLSPERSAIHLDVPAYRYQRILMPLLARALSLGFIQAIPWILLSIGVISHVLGTWAVSEVLAGWGSSRWYALVYSLWAGHLLAVILYLPEPLAYGLISAALLARLRNRISLSWVLFGLALFAKEVTVLFAAAAWVYDLLHKNYRHVAGMTLVTLLPYGLFQLWLWGKFGQIGIASGGEMATPFELIPFMGMWRIGFHSLSYLLAMFVVFGPAVILPATWGSWTSIRSILGRQYDENTLALLLNCLAIIFLPFSTFRETGGLLRFASGLVLAVIMYAGRYRMKKVLNYSALWLVLNVFLLKS